MIWGKHGREELVILLKNLSIIAIVVYIYIL